MGEVSAAQGSRNWCGFDTFVVEEVRRKFKVKTNESTLVNTVVSTEDWNSGGLVKTTSRNTETGSTRITRLSNACVQQTEPIVLFRSGTITYEAHGGGGFDISCVETLSDGGDIVVCDPAWTSMEYVGYGLGPNIGTKPEDTPTVKYGNYSLRNAIPSGLPGFEPVYSASGQEDLRSFDELSDEQPMPDIRAYVLGLLPAPDEFSLPQYRSKASIYTETSLDSGDNTILSAMAQEVKAQLYHQPSPTCYLRVWLRVAFYPEGWNNDYSKVEVLESWAYEWAGSGNPCMPDSGSSWDQPSNRILGPERELDIPEENGSVFMEIVKMSIINGYTPDDPLEDGTRPVPDVNPNWYPNLE